MWYPKLKPVAVFEPEATPVEMTRTFIVKTTDLSTFMVARHSGTFKDKAFYLTPELDWAFGEDDEGRVKATHESGEGNDCSD